jgi:ABC-type phosphate/phosphonate transport system substrate-binding protein
MTTQVGAVAFLPMYVVRGTRDHAETLWLCLRDCLRNSGIEVPERAASFEPRLRGWLHPELIIGQTCGLPYISKLHDHVELIGTPDYGVEGCAAGFYHSTLVVEAADKRQHLSEFFGGTVALNGIDSQSGYGALMRSAAPFARNGRFFGRAIHARSHDAAMRLVAQGLADVAAIDSITWRISRRFDPDTQGLKSIGTTEPTPGLPFIAAKGKFDGRMFNAVLAAVASLPDDARNAFGLRSVASLRKSDYEVIRTNLAEAEAVHSLPKLEEMPAPAPSS